MIVKLFQIRESEKQLGYELIVKTYDAKTTNYIFDNVLKNLNEQRDFSARKNLEKKIATLQTLIVQKKDEMGLKDLDQNREESSLLENKLADLKDRIKDVQDIYNREQSKYFALELQVQHLKKSKKLSLNSNKRVKFEKAKKLKKY